jgi:hypothetical protein
LGKHYCSAHFALKSQNQGGRLMGDKMAHGVPLRMKKRLARET